MRMEFLLATMIALAGCTNSSLSAAQLSINESESYRQQLLHRGEVVLDGFVYASAASQGTTYVFASNGVAYDCGSGLGGLRMILSQDLAVYRAKPALFEQMSKFDVERITANDSTVARAMADALAAQKRMLTESPILYRVDPGCVRAP